jgi:hypothetical protein
MGNKVDQLGSKKQYLSIKKEIDTAILKVVGSGFYIGGEEVNSFEKKVARFLKVKYAVSVNSGTDALFLSLKAAGVKNGDEVITTPFTFIATAEVIANLGAKPVFVDIESDTFNINPNLIEKEITSKTKAIIPVHLFGQPAEMDKIMAIARKYKLSVIEDAAQSFGAEFRERMVGTIGNCGAFSFFPSKNLGCFGDGGLIATNDIKFEKNLRFLKNHGSSQTDKYKNLILGVNSRLDAIQASILKVKLKYIRGWNKERVKIAAYYSDNLKNIKEIILPAITAGHVFNQYTIMAENRDKLKLFLEKNGISTKIYYPLALHLQPAFKYLNYRKGDFPVSEEISNKVLSLPIYPELSEKEQSAVISKIKEFYNHK